MTYETAAADVVQSATEPITGVTVYFRPLSIDAALDVEGLTDESVTTGQRAATMKPHVMDCIVNEDGTEPTDTERDAVLRAIGFAGFHWLLGVLMNYSHLTEETQEEQVGNLDAGPGQDS